MAGEYAETAALLAVLEGNSDEARRIMAEMYPGEARNLRQACEKLTQTYFDVRDNEGFRGP